MSALFSGVFCAGVESAGAVVAGCENYLGSGSALYERIRGETSVPSETSDNVHYMEYKMAYLSHSTKNRGGNEPKS